ncbi:MAG: DUF3291 domain-containing protein [Streptosporangiaceae bacterium]
MPEPAGGGECELPGGRPRSSRGPASRGLVLQERAPRVPRGRTPATGEAEERVLHRREFGPTPFAFTLREHFPPPDAADFGPIRSPEEWTCPA